MFVFALLTLAAAPLAAQPAPLQVTSFTTSDPSLVFTGQQVTWTVTAAGGAAPYSYKFFVHNGVSWSVGRDWGASNTWSWRSPGGPEGVGTYRFQVWVRNAGSSSDYDAWAPAGPVETNYPWITIMGVTGPSSTPTAGSPATYTVRAAGGNPPPSFRFDVYAGDLMSPGRDWSTANSWTWVPPAPGTYRLWVYAREEPWPSGFIGSPTSRDVGLVTVLMPSTLAVTSLTASTPSPVPAGTPVTWSARALGGTKPYTYKFLVFNGSTWTVGRDWSTESDWTWAPASSGSYFVQVWVRNAGSVAGYDAWGETPVYTATAPVALTPTSLAPTTSVYPNSAGTPVTWSASAVGGTGPYTYKFFVHNGSSWSVGREWGPDSTWTWVPSSPGTYDFQVWLRNSGSATTYDAWTSSTMTVGAATPLTVTGVWVTPGAPLVVGGPATVVTKATGGTGPYRFKYWVYDGSTWSVGREWDANATWEWTPTAAGTYYLQVWVQNAGGGTEYGVAYDSPQAITVIP